MRLNGRSGERFWCSHCFNACRMFGDSWLVSLRMAWACRRGVTP